MCYETVILDSIGSVGCLVGLDRGLNGSTFVPRAIREPNQLVLVAFHRLRTPLPFSCCICIFEFLDYPLRKKLVRYNQSWLEDDTNGPCTP
jgi:hypothetical protein